MKTKVEIKNLLQNAKLKNTTPRVVILETLLNIKHPETAGEIHKRLKKNKIDLVTLYRTLASFEKNKLVKRVDLHKDAIYYELDLDHHHHIVCTKCNKLERFENSEIEKVLNKIISKSVKFKNIKEHSLELFGICKKCA
ncbi:MAG: Fur family transcriptional regulator [Candidatus Pacebacteria bacterium]|nr:Fur family transcriptional regulator [Candidatus Paceibacterota bacterium]